MQERISNWSPKLPLVAVTLFFSTGIVLQDLFSWKLLPVWAALLAFALLFLLLGWRQLPSPCAILPLVVVTGALVMLRQQTVIRGDEPNHLRQLAIRLPQHVAVRGTVRSDPVEHAVEHEASKKNAPRSNIDFEMRVTEVRFATTWQEATGSIQVRLPVLNETNEPSHIEFGQQLELEGVLKEPASSRNFGLFDYALYLERQGIRHLLQADQAKILGPASGWKWIFDARQYLGKRLTLGIENDSLATGIIRGMLLGYREDIPPDVNRSFRLTGTLHVFAISGSHISLIALALLVVLRLLRVPMALACALVLPMLGFYVIATGLRASAIRSLIMAAVVLFGWSIRRPSALLNNLAASALVLIAWDPFQLFDPGFQLSFVVVTALVVVAPYLESWFQRRTEPDPFLPSALVPRWRKNLSSILNACTGLFSVSVAAWIGSLGLNIYYFNLISFVALPANLLIVPLASASVALGLISLVTGWVWNELAITLNTTHALLIHLMIGISEKLSAWKAGYFYVPQPAPGWIVAGYVILIICGFLWARGRWKWGFATGFGSTSILVLFLVTKFFSNDLRLDVMDVGAGQAVLITGPRFERILVDAGSRSHGQNVVEPFLRSRGVNRLDHLFLSGGDAAHYGGAAVLLENFPISKVTVPNASFRSKGWRQLLDAIHKTAIPLQSCHAGDLITTRSGLFQILWPESNTPFTRADDLSLIMELQHETQTILFATDAGVTLESAVADRVRKPCSLLIQGLHSSEETLSDSFLKTIQPKWVVLNTAEFPLKAYPSPELLERLKESGAGAHRTDESGGAILRMDHSGIHVEPFLGTAIRQNRR